MAGAFKLQACQELLLEVLCRLYRIYLASQTSMWAPIPSSLRWTIRCQTSHKMLTCQWNDTSDYIIVHGQLRLRYDSKSSAFFTLRHAVCSSPWNAGALYPT